jgi:8-oxo-dGTP pyrophosphatase MutT (NUDIX family)
MSFAERSRRAVDERIDRLREKYGSFPVETRTVENDPAYFDDGVEYFGAGHRGAAGALVRDEVGRVLLIEHPDGPVWETPGGGHDPGRRYEETALREVREETTVECEITGVFRVERKRYVDATDPERRGYLAEVIFGADHVAGTPDAGADPEVLDAEWFASPTEPLADALVGRDVWPGNK